MVKIKIGSKERNTEDVDSSWINQQINRRRKRKMKALCAFGIFCR